MSIERSAHRRVLCAAVDVATSSAREAAIVGGIVRSTLDSGTLDVTRVARYASEIMTHFGLVDVDLRAPGAAEIAMVLDRYEQGSRRLTWPPPDER
jgi:hypothetical protein